MNYISVTRYFKYVLLGIIVLCNLLCFVCKADKQPKPLGLTVVCIDPGHGGKDAGCVSPDKLYKEKDIVLGIGKKLASKIKATYPKVKVVMTRDDDRFIELAERADIANRHNANLFISIHVNSVSLKSKSAKTASGFSIHTLGQSSIKNRDLFKANMDLCKRENSVILLENDYSTTYQGFDPNDAESYIFFNLMQNANLEHSLLFASDVDNQMKGGPIKVNRGISQDPFLVLWKTKMPSVLIETGFITNSADLKCLGSSAGQNAIANNIFNAFATFKKRYDKSLNIEDSNIELNNDVYKDDTVNNNDTTLLNPKTNQPIGNKANNIEPQYSENTPYYGIQVMASSKILNTKDKIFRGYELRVLKGNKLNKYIIVPNTSLIKVKQQYSSIKKYFPGAFIVKVEGDKASIVK